MIKQNKQTVLRLEVLLLWAFKKKLN